MERCCLPLWGPPAALSLAGWAAEAEKPSPAAESAPNCLPPFLRRCTRCAPFLPRRPLLQFSGEASEQRDQRLKNGWEHTLDFGIKDEFHGATADEAGPEALMWGKP